MFLIIHIYNDIEVELAKWKLIKDKANKNSVPGVCIKYPLVIRKKILKNKKSKMKEKT